MNGFNGEILQIKEIAKDSRWTYKEFCARARKHGIEYAKSSYKTYTEYKRRQR